MRTPRFLLVLLIGLAVPALGACGGGDDDEGAPAGDAPDVATLLEQTFTGSKQIDSGQIAFELVLTSSDEPEPVRLSLNGPFQSGGKGKLPQLDLAASVETAQRDVEAGLTLTQDKGFIALDGQDYVLSDAVFAQFRDGYEAQAAAQESGGQPQSLASLGIDPRAWLTDAANAGTESVGDDETYKITGGVDVEKLLDDVEKALSQLAALGAAGAGQLPEALTQAQRRTALEAIKDPRVEIYTGVEDKILRRLVVDLGIENDDESGTMKLDLAITDLNQDQEFSAPENAKPAEPLIRQLLGFLGQRTGAGTSGGSPDADLEAFSKCLQDAGQDTKAAAKCSELLTTP